MVKVQESIPHLSAPPRPKQPPRSMASAALASTLGFLPVFLVAAQGSLVRAELDFSAATLGLAVSVYFAMGAVMSAPSGWLSERLGPRAGMLASGGATAALLVAIAAFARSAAQLVVLLALAGAVNALCQTSADLSVARGVPQRLQGFAFGVKTSCVPLATLLAGLAIPGIGVRYGWRASFLAAAVLVVLLALLAPGRRSFVPAPRGRDAGTPDTPKAGLVLLAVAGALSIGAVNTMGAFYAESATQRGMTPGAAGWWLAAGSLAAVAARVLWGVVSDRMERGHLRTVAWLWATGSVGIAMLALGASTTVFAVGTAIAFVAGGGWTGLFISALVRANPSAPAVATGFVMTGMMAGSVVGPLAFGALAGRGSYTAAWLATALALLVAAALLRPVVGMFLPKGRP